MLLRHEKESAVKDTMIGAAAQKESELREAVKRLQEDLSQVRKHSHGAIGLSAAGSTHHTAPALSNAASFTSLTSAGLASSATGSGGELETLSREQLIQRCQREIAMKQAVVNKLEYIGKMKGINDELKGGRSGSKKSKKDEARRMRALFDMQLEQERQIHRQGMEKLQVGMGWG
jgi:hypothetical protein